MWEILGIGLVSSYVVAFLLDVIFFKNPSAPLVPFHVHLFFRIFIQFVLGYGIYGCFSSGNWLLYLLGVVLVLGFISHIILVFDRKTLEEGLQDVTSKMLK